MEERHFHRRNLPHLYYNEGTYFITYRLADSLPLDFLKKLHDEIKSFNAELSIKEKRIFRKYDELLDKGTYGKKYLSLPSVAEEAIQPIHFVDGKEYKLLCYCIMPNHIHLVFRLLPTNSGISKIMQSIKRISGRECNKVLKRKGKFWQVESFDRLIRTDRELFNVIKYVLDNPINAELVMESKEWKYSYLCDSIL